MRYTPENITQLEPNEIFVFGSNAEGMHAAGAARIAHEQFGALWGKGRGPQGQSYAIVTMNTTPSQLSREISAFLDWANCHPEKTYLVTKIGCGIAGWTVEEIAYLFKCTIPPNVILPKEFHGKV